MRRKHKVSHWGGPPLATNQTPPLPGVYTQRWRKSNNCSRHFLLSTPFFRLSFILSFYRSLLFFLLYLFSYLRKNIPCRMIFAWNVVRLHFFKTQKKGREGRRKTLEGHEIWSSKQKSTLNGIFLCEWIFHCLVVYDLSYNFLSVISCNFSLWEEMCLLVSLSLQFFSSSFVLFLVFPDESASRLQIIYFLMYEPARSRISLGWFLAFVNSRG